MIRPVLYVDLPGIIYALDRRARMTDRAFATFICAPDYEETHSGLFAVLQNLSPIRTSIRTWIAEEHWRMQGIAQTRVRPHTGSWDLLYLATLTNHEANSIDVLLSLMEESLNSAMMHGMLRVFARTNEDAATLELFQRASFQCYARELLYVRESPVIATPEAEGFANQQLHLRRWQPLDTWGFSRLHDATTPRRVQIAEMLGSDEVAHQYVPRMRSWRIPGIEPRDESFVVEEGARLVAWARIRQGWAGLPHQLWMKIHPDCTDIAPEVLRFALGRLCQRGVLPSAAPQGSAVICQVRDYEGAAIDALRHEGFAHVDTKAILVRHLTMRAFNERAVHSVEQARINYGVKGLGTVQSTPAHTHIKRETLHATSSDH